MNQNDQKQSKVREVRDPSLGVTQKWWKNIGKQKVLRHNPAQAPICVPPVLARKGSKTRGYKTGSPGVPGG